MIVYWEGQERNSTHFGHCRLFNYIHTLAQSYVRISWENYSADLGTLLRLQCTKNRKIGSNITLKGRIHSALHSVWTTLYTGQLGVVFQLVEGRFMSQFHFHNLFYELLVYICVNGSL